MERKTDHLDKEHTNNKSNEEVRNH